MKFLSTLSSNTILLIILVHAGASQKEMTRIVSRSKYLISGQMTRDFRRALVSVECMNDQAVLEQNGINDIKGDVPDHDIDDEKCASLDGRKVEIDIVIKCDGLNVGFFGVPSCLHTSCTEDELIEIVENSWTQNNPACDVDVDISAGTIKNIGGSSMFAIVFVSTLFNIIW